MTISVPNTWNVCHSSFASMFTLGSSTTPSSSMGIEGGRPKPPGAPEAAAAAAAAAPNMLAPGIPASLGKRAGEARAAAAGQGMEWEAGFSPGSEGGSPGGE